LERLKLASNRGRTQHSTQTQGTHQHGKGEDEKTRSRTELPASTKVKAERRTQGRMKEREWKDQRKEGWREKIIAESQTGTERRLAPEAAAEKRNWGGEVAVDAQERGKKRAWENRGAHDESDLLPYR